MHAGACDLAGGEQSRHRRVPPQIGEDAAHAVVRSRGDGHRRRGDVQPDLATLLVGRREPRRDVGHRRRVEDHRLSRLIAHLQHRAGDDVARRQIAERVEPVHEPLARGVAEHRPLAPQRLRQQPGRVPGHIERRRMKLHELQVGERRARQPGEGEPLADRRVGTRPPPEDAAGAARGEHDAVGLRSARHPRHGRPRRTVPQLHRHRASVDPDDPPVPLDDLLEEAVAARDRTGRRSAWCTRRALCPPSSAEPSPSSKPCPSRKFGDRLRRLPDQTPRPRPVTQAGAGRERVGGVELRAVVLARDGGHAALRPRGRRQLCRARRHDGHRPRSIACSAHHNRPPPRRSRRYRCSLAEHRTGRRRAPAVGPIAIIRSTD